MTGAAVTLFPVYALVSASIKTSIKTSFKTSIRASQGISLAISSVIPRGWGQKLQQQWQRLPFKESLVQKRLFAFQNLSASQKLSAVQAKTGKLLKLTDFGETALMMPDALEGSVHISRAEQIMAVTLMLVGECLSSQQIKLLSASMIEPPPAVGLVRRVMGWLQGLGTPRREMAKVGQITGIASDLETRSLVLVKDYVLIWPGLSADQQLQLQQQIVRLLSGEFANTPQPLLTHTGLTRFGQRGLQHAEKGHPLVQSGRSFWVEVLRMVAWLQREGRSRSAVRAIATIAANAGKNVLAEAKPSAEISARVKTAEIDISCDAINNPVDCLEATVTAASYIEHPLEKVLKWVDKWLLWLESHWQRLLQWMGQCSAFSQYKK